MGDSGMPWELGGLLGVGHGFGVGEMSFVLGVMS